MEAWALAHLNILGMGQLDSIIFMRVVRVLLLVIAGFILIFEPMNCGGRNRSFHLVLVGLCWGGAWASWSQAQARMALVMADPVHLINTVPTAELFWPEFAFTVAAIVACGRLVYDAIMYRRLKKLGCAADCGKKCIPIAIERRDRGRNEGRSVSG